MSDEARELREAEPTDPFPADFDPFDNWDFGVRHRWRWAYGRRIDNEEEPMKEDQNDARTAGDTGEPVRGVLSEAPIVQPCPNGRSIWEDFWHTR